MLYKALSRLMSIALFTILANSVQAQEIRVLTYNIHHGEDVNGKLDLRQIGRL